MPIRSIAARAISAFLIAGVAGCDPGVHLAWQGNFSSPVDYDCIEKALRAVSPDVIQGTYKEDGNGSRGFKPGTIVTQFLYSDPIFYGGFDLDVAVQSNGKAHYWHGWSKVGTEITADEQRGVVPVLNRANRSVERRCGLPFSGMSPVIGDG